MASQKKKRGRIGALLEMLAQEDHSSPFEHTSLQFLVTSDIASHIHALKHRIGVSINAESARYRELKDSVYAPTDWPVEEAEQLEAWAQEGFKRYHECLNRLVAAGIPRKRAKESARYYLTYATQLTWMVTMNFRSFMHFLHKRYDTDAQLEIHDIAKQMLVQVRETHAFDLALKAYCYDYD